MGKWESNKSTRKFSAALACKTASVTDTDGQAQTVAILTDYPERRYCVPRGFLVVDDEVFRFSVTLAVSVRQQSVWDNKKYPQNEIK